MDTASLVSRLGSRRVLVVGDLMLDRYVGGQAERVSPEAPVLVLAADADEVRLGGAASVAAMLSELGATVTAAGVIGDDSDGRVLRRLLTEDGIDQRAVCSDAERITTSKERVLGRSSHGGAQQIVRIDREDRRPISDDQVRRLDRLLGGLIAECDAILVSDYGKGVCTPAVLARVIAGGALRNVPIIVDPAPGADYSRYAGATVLIPNRREAEVATGRRIEKPADALAVAGLLSRQTGVPGLVIKLDRDGIALFESKSETDGALYPTRTRNVCDATGAGDMVMAVIGLALANGLSLAESIPLANAAAGLEVERLGVSVISRTELAAELLPPSGKRESKLLTIDQAAAVSRAYRCAGQSVVLTNGCFDLLHSGHVRYLQQAAELGDVLMVALNSDSSVRQLKGPGRPLLNQNERAALLSALRCVRHVVLFDELTPHDLLRAVRPDVLVKGGDYRLDEVVGREVVEEYGGQVRVVGKIDGISTSRILSAAREPSQNPVGAAAFDVCSISEATVDRSMT